jgi:hypothetical protein
MKSRKSLGCQRHFSLNNSATTKQPKMVTNKNRYSKKNKEIPFSTKNAYQTF